MIQMDSSILTIVETIKPYAEVGTAIGTLFLALVTFMSLIENRIMLKRYNRLAERYRKYEMKKQIYLELLDIILEANKFFGYARVGGIIDDKFEKEMNKFYVVQYKMELSDCPRVIYDAIEKLIKSPKILQDDKQTKTIITDEIIPAMKKDLEITSVLSPSLDEIRAKSWWQFWR